MPGAIDLTLFNEVGVLEHEQMDGNLQAIQDFLNALKNMADLDPAGLAEILDWAGTAYGVTTDQVRAALAWETVAYSASFAPNWATNSFNMKMTVAGALTVANPTSVNAMSVKQLYLIGDSATQRTVTFGSYYKGDIPTINDLTNAKGYLLVMQPVTATHIILTSVRAL